jgi:hypothetical protein
VIAFRVTTTMDEDGNASYPQSNSTGNMNLSSPWTSLARNPRTIESA